MLSLKSNPILKGANLIYNKLIISTSGRNFIDITDRIQGIVSHSGINTGLCHIFIQHTSASLILSENFDPDVLSDLETFMEQLVQDGHPAYRHRSEGVDDMAAHIRSVITQTQLAIPIVEHSLALGTWQGIYLWEHRLAPHQRNLIVMATG